jgi:DNA-binding CsgD family transcriptional regulator
VPGPGTPDREPAARLIGRDAECATLDRLVAEVQGGHSRALVVRGEAGAGKTVLLDYLARRASDAGCRVLTVAAIQSEMELAFAVLHQLCWPLRDHLTAIPEPQRDALSTAFGLIGGGVAPDRFLVGLAALSLLAEAATDRPLVCVVDDEQWLDRASARALAFVAHRVGAESVGLVFGGRVVSDELEALPEMVVGGLAHADARALLATVLDVPVAAAVVDQIVAETGGNPLALIELPKGLTAGELATGFLVPGAGGPSARVEESFRRRAEDLPPDARHLLLVAAAEPLGDPVPLWRAAAGLGISASAAPPLEEAGLIVFGDRVRFRHPLVRSAVYQSASAQERREVHAALAEATDAELDPDRRAWHRALAALGPDEDVAADLERSAVRAQARGGFAATAALLERSALLTIDPQRRAQRSIAAAGAHIEAGAPKAALPLLAAATDGPLDEPGRAHAEFLRGDVAAGWGHMGEATDLYLSAARRLESLDARLARDAYATALVAADLASDLAGGATVVEVARAARAAPVPAGPRRPLDILVDGLAMAHIKGPEAAATTLREALSIFATAQLAPEDAWWWGFAQLAALPLWDYEASLSLAARFVHVARGLGALRMLAWALEASAQVEIWSGDFAIAASVIAEEQTIIEAIGSTPTPRAVADLAAWSGDEAEANSSIDAAIEMARTRGQGGTIKMLQSSKATLCNALGRYEDAVIAAELASRKPIHSSSHHALRELVEAAVRCGKPTVAAAALEHLSESTQVSGTDWALGVEARSWALLSTGDAAEARYREAIERLDRSPLRPEAARAHLLYGEWLRREKRRVEAREQLRTAHGLFDAMGARAFAERARIELAATGERARSRRPGPTADLTPQERHIAQLAAGGATNQEIATQLFLSANTVDYHLRKVFLKLMITRRGQLHDAFASAPP